MKKKKKKRGRKKSEEKIKKRNENEMKEEEKRRKKNEKSPAWQSLISQPASGSFRFQVLQVPEKSRVILEHQVGVLQLFSP